MQASSILLSILIFSLSLQCAQREDVDQLFDAIDQDNTNAIDQLLKDKAPNAKQYLVNAKRLGDPAIVYASYNGKDKTVDTLIKHGADVNATGSGDQTALMKASEKNRKNIVEKLINSKADINARDKNGQTALIIAAESGSTDCVKVLLENGADLTLKDKQQKTALDLAKNNAIKKLLTDRSLAILFFFESINKNEIDEVTKRIKKDPHLVDARNTVGSLPLITASEKGHIKIVETLLNNGADVNTKSSSGVTSLMVASQKGYLNIVNTLIGKGADVNARDNLKRTALMFTTDLQIADKLISKGARVNDKDSMGNTVLMNVFSIASEFKGQNVLGKLLDQGADINAQNNHGETALIQMSDIGKLAMVEYLLDKKAKIDMQDTNGYTALMRASNRGYLNIVNMLLEHGANPNIQSDISKMSALMFAAESDRREVVTALIQGGADVLLTDESGHTAKQLAKNKGHTEIVKILEQAEQAKKPQVTTNNLLPTLQALTHKLRALHGVLSKR